MDRQTKEYLLSLALFGTNGVFASGIPLPSHEIVLLRTAIGGAFLVAAFLLAGRRVSCLSRPRQAAALLASGVAQGVCWIFLFEAYRLIGVGVASLAYYCGPVIVMALSPWLFGERLNAGKVCGFACVVAGAFLVVAQGGTRQLSPWGLTLGAMSAVMYALVVILSRKAPDVDGIEATTVQVVGSFAAAAAYVGIRSLFVSDLVMPTGMGTWANLAALGVINTAIAFHLYFSSIGRLPVQRVAVCGYLEPLSAVAFSVILLHEAMTPTRALGACLIVGGALAAEVLGGRIAGGRQANRRETGGRTAVASPAAGQVADGAWVASS